MPITEVKGPGGKIHKVKHPDGASKTEIIDFAKQNATYGESALTMLSGAVAEPVAGVAGIAQAINPFAGEGAGGRAGDST